MNATALSPAHQTRLTDTGLDIVTGAFSYSGRAIAAELVGGGRRVRTMTGHPGRAEQDDTLETRPLDFDDLPGMVASMSGATTLYNTYWVRFAHGTSDHQQAVENSRALFYAARRAGIQRVVHVSITHPSVDSPFPYFRGKALVERALAETGTPMAFFAPPSCSVATACSSTTSPGSCVIYPPSPSEAAATTAFDLSTSGTSPSSPSPWANTATTASSTRWDRNVPRSSNSYARSATPSAAGRPLSAPPAPS